MVQPAGHYQAHDFFGRFLSCCNLVSGAQKRVPRSTLRSAFQFCQERNEASSNCKFVERNDKIWRKFSFRSVTNRYSIVTEFLRLKCHYGQFSWSRFGDWRKKVPPMK